MPNNPSNSANPSSESDGPKGAQIIPPLTIVGADGHNRGVPCRVGYKNPPLEYCFKPGQSGNPKGRPPGSLNLKSQVERALRKKVKVRVGKEIRDLPALEAILRTHTKKAIKGDTRSAGIILSFVPKAGLFDHQADLPDGLSGSPHALFAWRPSRELFENIDRTQLSDDEQIELARLAELVDLGGGMTALSVTNFARAQELVNKARGKVIAVH
jgi:hypothetical protein